MLTFLYSFCLAYNAMLGCRHSYPHAIHSRLWIYISMFRLLSCFLYIYTLYTHWRFRQNNTLRIEPHFLNLTLCLRPFLFASTCVYFACMHGIGGLGDRKKIPRRIFFWIRFWIPGVGLRKTRRDRVLMGILCSREIDGWIPSLHLGDGRYGVIFKL